MKLTREDAYKILLGLTVIVWVGAWVLNQGYPFWAGVAGMFTIPIVLAALAADNLLQ